MRKIYIRTSDIFDYKDAEKRMKHFDFCRKKALECGLISDLPMWVKFLLLK